MKTTSSLGSECARRLRRDQKNRRRARRHRQFIFRCWAIGLCGSLAVASVVFAAGVARHIVRTRRPAVNIELAAPLVPKPATPVVIATRPIAPAVAMPTNLERIIARRQYSNEFLRVRTPLDTDRLKTELRRVPEIILEDKPGSQAGLAQRHALAHRGTWEEPAPEPTFLSHRSDLIGLPFAKGRDCYLPDAQALALESLSGKLHGYLTESAGAGWSRADHLSACLLRAGNESWTSYKAVPTLMQIMQAQDESCRRLMVDVLAKTQGDGATEALARRAIFDLSAAVREQAVRSLRGRPEADYRPILLQGLRHPWRWTAEFAAEAIVHLNQTTLLPELVAMLRLPGPGEPARDPAGDDDALVVREVVQVNHMKNCLLCHAASVNNADRARGLVPDPTRPRPTREYYRGTDGAFVRADVTYLRQDFSITQPVFEANAGVQHQRFDYLVRTRKLAAKETTSTLRAATGRAEPNPQAEAILFALRELTGADQGPDPDAWHTWLRK